jgi:aspartyl-tRNA(Asn)/glutamyl-tRNA(Gln) amidotransferase subunit A
MSTSDEKHPAFSAQTSDPIYYKDATELAFLIRTKQLSPREVVQSHIDRIDAVNPQINAIVTSMAEDALKAADLAERAVMSGAALGPLHGVPFTIKDSIDTGGTLTQRGSKLFAGYIPEKDAPAVTRFKEAGAIPLAKTNLPEFSAWFETDNLLTGRTNNPWNLERTPGGSSGGESAAIAAGLSPIGIGSDVAISVRGPAALTGIAALKATHGRIPYTGHHLQCLSRWWHIGPMARTVRDVALGFSLLQGPDGIDGYANHSRIAAPAPRPIGQPIRVGWVSEAAFGPVDPEITAAVTASAALLKDYGCNVEEVGLSFMKETDFASPYFMLLYQQLIPYVKELAKGREAELYATSSDIIEMSTVSLTEYMDGQAKMEQLRSLFAGYFAKYDVLLCPVTPYTAQPHQLQEVVVNGTTVSAFHVMAATAPFNMTGLPALSVPFGLSSERLPISVQLISKWFDEATILQLGQIIETATTKTGFRHPLP